MAIVADKYITLMASLPALASPLTARELPLSRLGLAARLRLLEDDDAALLQRIQAIMVWERIDMAMTDPEVKRKLDALLPDLDGADLRGVIRDRFDLRTVLAALRRRRLGHGAPERHEPWGHGRLVDHIRRNWSRPHFGLRRSMPWLAELRDLHDSGATLELDRAIARVAWHSLVTAARAHEFDFDAVVLYVLRYDMIERWLHRSSTTARERFDQLVVEGLGNCGASIPELG